MKVSFATWPASWRPFCAFTKWQRHIGFRFGAFGRRAGVYVTLGRR